MMSTAIAMAVELMVYGLISGLLYAKVKGRRFGIYLTLIPTMLIGRMAWGVAVFCYLVYLAMHLPGRSL